TLTFPTSSRMGRDAPTVTGPDLPAAEWSDARTAELAANLELLRERLAVACRAAGRSPAEVTLVAVTKTFPAADVVRLARLGVTDVGENRDQEARAKLAEVADHGVVVRVHFIGRLQRN